MKKLLTIIFISVSTICFAQFTGRNSEKSSGRFLHIFHRSQKPHAQMSHFGRQRKDPNIKDNGTMYIRSRKSKLTVDGSGYGVPGQHKTKRRERNRIKKQNH